MPPRRNRNAADAGDAGGDADVPQQQRNYHGRAKVPVLMTLKTDNFDAWDTAARNLFYAEGWDPMYDASRQPPLNADGNNNVAATADDEDMPPKSRRLAWGTITASLQDDVLLSTKSITLGHVETLLRHIRDRFYRKSAATRNNIKTKLHTAKLEEHHDLEAYITYIENLALTLAGLGYVVGEEDKRFYLLHGLPDDYDPAKQALSLLDEPTWETILKCLRDFSQSHPSILGSGSKPRKRLNVVLNTTHSRQHFPQDVCRDYTKGKCKRGHRCRFKHVKAPRLSSPLKCNYCHKSGHVERQCFKKQRDEKATAGKSSHAVNNTEDQDIDKPSSQPERKFEYQFGVQVFQVSELCMTTQAGDIAWLLDGGATCHIAWDETQCYDIQDSPSLIQVGGNHTLDSSKVGKRDIKYTLDGATIKLTLENVRIVPTFGRNIMAEAPFLDKGCSIHKDNGWATIVADHGEGACVAMIKQSSSNRLFLLRPLTFARASVAGASENDQSGLHGQSNDTKIKLHQNSSTTAKATQYGNILSATQKFITEEICAAKKYDQELTELQLWHQRLGHRNFRDVARILGVVPPSKPLFCRSCVEGKQHRHPLQQRRPSPAPDSPRPGYLFHSDMIGPFRIHTRNGERWAALLVDDYSRRIFLFLMRHKSDFLQAFKDFVTLLEADFGKEHVVAQLLTDGARSYTSNALDVFCTRKGIYQLVSPPYTPNMNAVAERNVRTIMEMTRTLLIHAGAPKKLYGEAMRYAVFIINRCPTYFSDGSYSTRLERWKGRPQPLAHKSIRVWGCAAWVLDLALGKDKLDAKSTMHIMLGVDPRYKCYLLGKLPHYELVRSPHVTFNESKFPCKGLASGNSDVLPLIDDGGHATTKDSGLDLHEPRRSSRAWTPSPQCLRNIVGPDSHPAAAQTHSVTAAIDSASVEEVFATATVPEKQETPRNHRHAMSLPESVEWRAAEVDEYISHEENKTFGPPTRLPAGHRAIPAAWVYKIKRDGRKKVRVVIRGYHMMPGIDFNETFAPVARITSVRICLAIAAQRNYEGIQVDIKTAYLSAPMDTEVYVHLPPAFNDNMDLKQSEQISQTVHRLLKGVPGIPQGAHLFNKRFDGVIRSMGFAKVADDFCFFRHAAHDIYLVIWVDDILMCFDKAKASAANSILDTLKKNFKVHVLGPVTDLLGVNITRDRGSRIITLDQSQAVLAILGKAGMKDCNSSPTPLPLNAKFTKADCPLTAYEQEDMRDDAKWFRSNLASCIYLQLWTRPDIAFAVSKLSKFMHNPGSKHLAYLKHLLRYLKGSSSRKLVYDFSSEAPRHGVYGYYDAAHADDIDTRRSTMAYIFFFHGCAISWKSKLHTYVTTSTNHSEYVSSAKAAREAKWLWKIFSHLGLRQQVSPIAMFSDSRGAIAMNYNPVHYEANKHVDLADHYAREQVHRGIITISHVPTTDMVADVLTKVLPTRQFTRLINIFTS